MSQPLRWSISSAATGGEPLIDIALQLMAACLLLSGSIVVLIGSIGMLRLPDFFCRLHSAGVIETLGAWLVLAGLLLLSTSLVIGFKVILITVLILVLSPVNSHVLARTARESDERVPGEDLGNEYGKNPDKQGQDQVIP